MNQISIDFKEDVKFQFAFQWIDSLTDEEWRNYQIDFGIYGHDEGVSNEEADKMFKQYYKDVINK